MLGQIEVNGDSGLNMDKRRRPFRPLSLGSDRVKYLTLKLPIVTELTFRYHNCKIY